MGKVKFSHDIDGAMRDQFDQLAEELPGKKHEIVEAMILAFKALPPGLQENLLSKRPEIRAAALTLIEGIAAPAKPRRVNMRTATRPEQ